MAHERIWVRCGDRDDYNSFDGLGEVADYLAEMRARPVLRFFDIPGPGSADREGNPLGVADDSDYRGQNYISLYHGGYQADDVGPGLSTEELNELNRLLTQATIAE